MPKIDEDEAWAAFERRDRRWDGRIIGAVTTTGIYCKPSCPARRPKREHVLFLPAPGGGLLGPPPGSNGRGGRHGSMIWRRRLAMRRTISSACSPARWAFPPP